MYVMVVMMGYHMSVLGEIISWNDMHGILT